MRKKFLACPLMPWSESCNRSETVTRTVTRMRFLRPLTVTVSFTLLPAMVMIPIGSGLVPMHLYPLKVRLLVFETTLGVGTLNCRF